MKQDSNYIVCIGMDGIIEHPLKEDRQSVVWRDQFIGVGGELIIHDLTAGIECFPDIIHCICIVKRIGCDKDPKCGKGNDKYNNQ